MNHYYLKHGDWMKEYGRPEIDEWLAQVNQCGYSRETDNGKVLRFFWEE